MTRQEKIALLKALELGQVPLETLIENDDQWWIPKYFFHDKQAPKNIMIEANSKRECTVEYFIEHRETLIQNARQCIICLPPVAHRNG